MSVKKNREQCCAKLYFESAVFRSINRPHVVQQKRCLFSRGKNRDDVIAGSCSLETRFNSVPTEHTHAVVSFLATPLDFRHEIGTKELDKSKTLPTAAVRDTSGNKVRCKARVRKCSLGFIKKEKKADVADVSWDSFTLSHKHMFP